MTDGAFYRFELVGPVKPYVRMTQRGKWCRPEAQEYLASKAAVACQLRAQMAEHDWPMLPQRVPLRCYLVLWSAKVSHRCDLDNILKATLDSAQGIVFHNDCWIDSIWAARRVGAARIAFGIGMAADWRGRGWVTEREHA